MADAPTTALGKLDGRDPDANYAALPYTGVSLYKDLELGASHVTRPAGADPGREPGQQWWTTSHLDKVTVLAEILTMRYHGQTLADQINALFAVLVEGADPADVRSKLGL